jgi:hypothetical protein
MAKVVDVRLCKPDNNRYTRELCNQIGCKAFFVDTNVLIDFKDPFGRSIEQREQQKQESIVDAINSLKSIGIASYSTLSVAIEYYKYIQVSSYKIATEQQKFDTLSFKRLRAADTNFADQWALRIKQSRELFGRKFTLYSGLPSSLAITDFKDDADFGDFALYDSVRHAERAHQFIFSNDADFYTFPDGCLLTVNTSVIEKARADGLLHESS